MPQYIIECQWLVRGAYVLDVPTPEDAEHAAIETILFPTIHTHDLESFTILGVRPQAPCLIPCSLEQEPR